jgi:hypothetical protein
MRSSAPSWSSLLGGAGLLIQPELTPVAGAQLADLIADTDPDRTAEALRVYDHV